MKILAKKLKQISCTFHQFWSWYTNQFILNEARQQTCMKKHLTTAWCPPFFCALLVNDPCQQILKASCWQIQFWLARRLTLLRHNGTHTVKDLFENRICFWYSDTLPRQPDSAEKHKMWKVFPHPADDSHANSVHPSDGRLPCCPGSLLGEHHSLSLMIS